MHEELGRGGYAIVYRAFDPRLKRHVAVKLLPPAAALDARRRERFSREIRITAACDHPHIVPVFATGQAEGAAYLELQEIRGRSLAEIIGDLQDVARGGQLLTAELLLQLAGQPCGTLASRMDQLTSQVRASNSYYEQVARWLAAIASALAHVHGRGILHGDVKPANLLVEPSGHIWLIDFGTACELTAAPDQAELLAGTLPYFAPERLDGDAPPDVRQDVYGLGATLYELLTLRRPVSGETAAAVMHELATRPPVVPRKWASTTPRGLSAIAIRCLARQPEDRFAAMADVKHALSEYVRAEEIESLRPKTRRSVRRSTLAVAAILLLTIIVAVIYRTRPGERSIAERTANLATLLPAGLKAELPSEQSPRLVISGVHQLVEQPFEIPLDLTTKDKLTWRIEPRRWRTHAGHSYTITPHRTGWLAAESLAQSWGGHLVAINDAAEQEFLNRTFLAPDSSGKRSILWIGLSAADIAAEYRWSTGEDLTFHNWNSGEPSRGSEVERYVAANWHLANNIDGDGRVGEWNDVPEYGLREVGGYQGVVELPHNQQSVPPMLSVRRRGGVSLAKLPPIGDQLPVAGRIVIELAGDARQLIEVMITVE